ncbi:MAG: hypothetical protein QXQ63_05670 [Candidatus Bathyarchaeia archaeon]
MSLDWKTIFQLLAKAKEKPVKRVGKWKVTRRGIRWNMWWTRLEDRILFHVMARYRGLREADYVRWLVKRDYESLSEEERRVVDTAYERFTEAFAE